MTELPPDLATKVLAADTRNIVQHVGDGGRLSTAERDLVAAGQVAGLDPAALQRSRVAALLLKWSKGQRLSQDERGEISTHLPSSRSALRAATSSHYQHEQKHYAGVFEVSDKTIKNWISDGRHAAKGEDLPPLDEPAKMAAWYRRVKSRNPPSNLVRLAKSAPAAAAPASTTSTPSAPAAAPISHDDFGYEIAVRYAAENLDYAQQQLRKARVTLVEGLPDEERIRDCETAVNKALEQYRKAKADEWDNMQRQGDMVPRKIMLGKFAVRLSALHQAVRSCPVRAGTKLALAPDLVRKIVALMNDELDAAFVQLHEDKWQFKERLTLS